MENKNLQIKEVKNANFDGMSTDEILAKALSASKQGQTEPTEQMEPTEEVTPIKQEAIDPDITQAGLEALQEVTAALEKSKAKRAGKTVEEKLQTTPQTPIQPLARRSGNLIKINELFYRREPKTDTFQMNGFTISIRLDPNYDSIVKAIGLATALVMDSGDNYVFGPNRRIIGDLVFIREITNLDLEFLTLPEIRISQLIETYDIIMPLITYIESLTTKDFQQVRNWYYTELNNSLAAAEHYQNSAKGIVDALAQHNIRDQETMAEQLAQMDDNKLSMVIDYISKVEPQQN